MIKASYESRNFTFEAYGQTTNHALNALKRGLSNHAKQYGIEDDWWFEDDIVIQYIKPNQAYRDKEEIKDQA